MNHDLKPRSALTRRQAMTLIGASAVVAPAGLRAAVPSSGSATTKARGDLFYASLQEIAGRIKSRDLSRSIRC